MVGVVLSSCACANVHPRSAYYMVLAHNAVSCAYVYR